MFSARLPVELLDRLQAHADALPGKTRTDVVEAACRALRFGCPVADCDFNVPRPGPVCPIHVRKVVLP